MMPVKLKAISLVSEKQSGIAGPRKRHSISALEERLK